MKNKYYYSLLIFLITLFGYFFFKESSSLIILLIIGMISILFLINIPSQWVEDSFAAVSYRLKISSVFAGGFFLAVASSLPEFFTSLTGVITHKIFDIGFTTVIWSALFNLNVIIGVSTFYKSEILVRKKLISRDLFFYGLTILLLLIIAYDRELSSLDFSLLILLYLVYVVILYFDKSRPYKTNTKDNKKTIILKIIFGIFFTAFLVYFLVAFGQKSVGLLNEFYGFVLPVGVLGAILYAPGTSMADLFVSISAIKKGEDTVAIINSISSNTFDLTICIAVSGLIYNLSTNNTVKIDHLNNSILLISILILSFIIVSIILWKGKVTKKDGIFLILFYVISNIVYFYSIL